MMGVCVVPQGGTPGLQGKLQAGLLRFFPDFFLASLLMPSQGPSQAQGGPVEPSKATLEQL